MQLCVNVLNDTTRACEHAYLIKQSDMQRMKLERQRYKKITNKTQMHLTNVNIPLNDNNAQ